MTSETTRYDSADWLDSQDAVTAYIEAVLEDGDPAVIRHAIDVVARARGLSDIAEATGLPRATIVAAARDETDASLSTLKDILAASLLGSGREAA